MGSVDFVDPCPVLSPSALGLPAPHTFVLEEHEEDPLVTMIGQCVYQLFRKTRSESYRRSLTQRIVKFVDDRIVHLARTVGGLTYSALSVYRQPAALQLLAALFSRLVSDARFRQQLRGQPVSPNAKLVYPPQGVTIPEFCLLLKPKYTIPEDALLQATIWPAAPFLCDQCLLKSEFVLVTSPCFPVVLCPPHLQVFSPPKEKNE